MMKGTTLRDVYVQGKKLGVVSSPTTAGRKAWVRLGGASNEADDGRRSEERGGGSHGAGVPSESVCQQDKDAAEPRRRIVVVHRLPLRAEPNADALHGFDFALDADALELLHFSRGLPAQVIYVGALPAAAASIQPSEGLAADLLDRFSCIPVFLGIGLHKDSYDGFCDGYLWPTLHYLLPLGGDGGGGGGNFNPELYSAFLTANSKYAERVYELLNADEDLVLIHGFHLWALPTILRHRSPRARIAFFLDSPFPPLEIFRDIPVSNDLLRDLLDADLLVFGSYDYGRHFIFACYRLLGLPNNSRRGCIGIEYFSRTVVVKIRSAGIDFSHLREVLSSPETAAKAGQITTSFAGRRVFLSDDDSDLVVLLNLLAMERLLESQEEMQGQVVLVQINNPVRSRWRHIHTVRAVVQATRDRINGLFSFLGYDPIVMPNQPLTLHDKLAYYCLADVCIATTMRAGLNLAPYIYTVCRQEGPIASNLAGAQRESAIVLSEFVRCLPSLSGAVRVNPLNLDDVVEGMKSALMLSEGERQMNQEKNYYDLVTHDVAYWRQPLDQDLQRASKGHRSRNISSDGHGGTTLSIRVLGPNFKKLLPTNLSPSYHHTKNRLILLDYDRAMILSQEMIDVLNKLSSDPKNTVFLISGQMKDELAGWFAPCERLGISAEYGYFTRWSSDSPWESPSLQIGLDWKNIVEPVMNSYADSTDGSYVEIKETSLVWHYEEADPHYGSCQAKELQDHLLSVLAEEHVSVKSDHKIVEVIPQGLGKGASVQSLLAAMEALPDFIFCVGDDRSDEDLFEAVTAGWSESPEADIFTCTVGNKPGLAMYYLDTPLDVLKVLESIIDTA